MLTDQQVRLYRKKRMQGKTQEAAAAIAQISERSARKWETGPLPSDTKKPRHWRTRSDPFEDVWEAEIVPLLQLDVDGILQSTTILTELQLRFPDQFMHEHLRTLQRRVREWRVFNGPPKEVFFPQEHPPGREACIDFTHATNLKVTINGQPFEHLFFTFKLNFSSWTFVKVVFSESFEALLVSLQEALWRLGGSPQIICHDNFSAATRKLKKGNKREVSDRFADLLGHYNMESRRINIGKANENGIVEKGHDLVKNAIRQHLLLRGSNDFKTIELYESFARLLVENSTNRPSILKVTLEKQHLQELPSHALPNYTVHQAKVSKWSTIRVNSKIYSVDSKLIGVQVTAHQYVETLVLFYNGKKLDVLPRLRGKKSVSINYRHIIWSLVRKAGAFARYKYREELFPTLTFRKAYDLLVSWRGQRADIEYVRILHLAASTMECLVEKALC